MTEVKDDLIANNNTINWIPESIGKRRFGDWLENVQDWEESAVTVTGEHRSISGNVSADICIRSEVLRN